MKKDLAMQNFIDVLQSLEIQQVWRMTNIKNVTSLLVYSLKYETTLQISRQTYQSKGKIPGQRYWFRARIIKENSMRLWKGM